MSTNRSIFEDIANGKRGGSGRYFEPGKYRLALADCFIKKGHKGTSFIAEFTVKHSTATGELDRTTGKPCVPIAPGATASFVVVLTNPKTMEMARGNVQDFVFALFGDVAADLTRKYGSEQRAVVDLLEDLCGDEAVREKRYRGKTIDLECFKKLKQDQKGEYTVHKWSHVAQTEAEMTAERRTLDGKGPAISA